MMAFRHFTSAGREISPRDTFKYDAAAEMTRRTAGDSRRFSDTPASGR